MYKLYISDTLNPTKVLYVFEEMGLKYTTKFVDVFKQENKTAEIYALTPHARIPVLDHDGQGIFESATICRYVAANEKSPLYPDNLLERAKIEEWMDFFNCHLGRWYGVLYFEYLIKPRVGMTLDEKACEEPRRFIPQQLAILDKWLGQKEWLAGDNLSIADFYAYAYLELSGDLHVDLTPYENVKNWCCKMEVRDSIRRCKEIQAKAA